ncbi:MAG: hypothetical protein HY996_10160 [Micrococcales bacterium]|nr:hypothetical protein [Micrococcales bacterium]
MRPAATRAAIGAGALVLAAVSIGLTGVAPARAAGSGISVSLDGVSYAPSLSAPLFGASRLVPNDAITRSFWVRNDAPSAGYLRLTLRDPTTTNVDFADALSLRADLDGWPGETVALQSARPCSRLSEGPVIAAGTAARVDLTAALGDLDGLHGQGGTAAFTVVVSLSGEPQGLGRSGCPTLGSSIAGFPGLGSGEGRRAARGTAVFGTSPSGWLPLSDGGSTITVEGGSPTTTPAPLPTRRLVASANTGRFYQEWDVALWLAALLLGGFGTQLLGRRRRAAARR